MALPLNVPTVTVMLDRPRRLAFTLGAMKRIKQITGQSATTAANEEVMGAMIWAMLINEDRIDVTVDDIEEMVHRGNLDEVTDAFNQVMGASTPEGKAEAVPETATP